MSDTTDVDEIRARKREELLERATAEDDSSAGGGTGSRDQPVHVEDEEHFERVIDEGVVLADFYADWCGPCQQLEPIVERVAGTTPATVAKVDVDRHQGLAGQYGVRGVPTMVLFQGGEPVERVVGVRGEEQLGRLIEEYA